MTEQTSNESVESTEETEGFSPVMIVSAILGLATVAAGAYAIIRKKKSIVSEAETTDAEVAEG